MSKKGPLILNVAMRKYCTIKFSKETHSFILYQLEYLRLVIFYSCPKLCKVSILAVVGWGCTEPVVPGLGKIPIDLPM